MSHFRIDRDVALAMLVLGLAGCSGGSKGPTVNYVEGVVTLDGTPVEGVAVGFSPSTAGGIGAAGITDAKGVFKLTSGQAGKPAAGAVTGEYDVTFEKITLASSGPQSTDDPNYGKKAPGKSAAPKPTYVVPQAYGSPKTSGFHVTVKEGKNVGDQFKFDLKSGFKGAKSP